MVNDAAGGSWDEDAPADGDNRKDGAQEIRGLRAGVALRLAQEHATLAGSSVGGLHKEGSAKCYVDDDEPANRPDGSTPLTSDDEGRMWFSDASKVLKVYNGTTFEATSGIQVASGSFNGAELNGQTPKTVTPGFATDLFILYVRNNSFGGSYAIPLINDETIVDVNIATELDLMFMNFERSGNDVILVGRMILATFSFSGTAEWLAFKFN